MLSWPLREKCLYSKLLCPGFSRILTEFGEILPFQSECGKMLSRITPDTDTFYTMSNCQYDSQYYSSRLKIKLSRILNLKSIDYCIKFIDHCIICRRFPISFFLIPMYWSKGRSMTNALMNSFKLLATALNH